MKNRIFNNIIRFDILLGITAFVIALVAAFFSVYGISTLFSGAFLATAIMASSLEIGKIVTVTFLYRYWNKTKGFLKTYLSLATIILMLVTSLGIFGYLSAAYQKSSIEFKATQDKIVMIDSQKEFYTNLISQSTLRIKSLTDARITQESRLSEAMTNTFLSRNPLQLRQLQEQTINLINQANEDIKLEMNQVKTNQLKIMSISEEVNDMRFKSAGNKDMQTFQFVADQFGTSLDKVAKWFIITLIIVFDPLAIALILAYNIVIFKKQIIVNSTSIDPPSNGEEPIVEEPIVEKPIVQETIVEEPIVQETIVQETIVEEPIVQEPTPIISTESIPEQISTITDPPTENTQSVGINDPFYKQMFKTS